MSTVDKILPAGHPQDYLNLCPLCSVLNISIYGVNGEIRILRMLQFITMYLGPVHDSCVSPPLCSPLCPHFRPLTRTSSRWSVQAAVYWWVAKWLGHCHCGRTVALCASSLYTSWWPGHWTDTQSYDSVHAIRNSARNEHKLCVPCVKIHRRPSGQTSDISSKHE